MGIDYKFLLYLYYPVFLLILIARFKNRFDSENRFLKLHNWSLLPAILILTVLFSDHILMSFWTQIPILKKYEYNPFNWDIVTFFFFLSILAIVYSLMRYIYRASFTEVFNLKLSQLPFILKICAILTIINILSIYFLDLNLLLNIEGEDLKILKSADIQGFLVQAFVAIIMAPIAEECVFRGLLYSPLYRKVGRYMAIILTSLIWTHGHFLPLIPSIGLFINGVILCWLYDRRGSLIHPIGFHMFQNSWVLLYYFM